MTIQTVACVAGGILGPGNFFGSRRAKWAAKLRGIFPTSNWFVYHPSRGAAAKTIQHSHAYPASYAGYTNGNKAVELEVIDKLCLCLEAVMIKMLLKKMTYFYSQAIIL